MSKKSRRRNKKILGALAAGLGAAALMRGRGTAAAANVDSGRGSGLRDTVDSTKTWITKKTPGDADTVKSYLGKMTGGNPEDRTGHIAQAKRGDYAKRMRKNAAMNYQRSQTFDAQAPDVIPHPYDRDYSGYERVYRKGGGIAKRGTGAAYKKGGRVKSMGIAKRGGGAAKR